MKTMCTFVAVFTLSLLPMATRAQDSQGTAAAASPEHFYRLHFAVAELDGAGKVTNTRTYEETVVTTGSGHVVGDQQIKTGSRVPIATGSYATNGNPTNVANTQFQYIDLGVNLDVRDATEHGEMLGFRLKAEVSSVARQTEIGGVGEPVIRQNVWDSTVLVLVGKPTVVFSSDDLDSKGKMQVEVTATKVE
jgi:Bacterial type II and III secretion system protein